MRRLRQELGADAALRPRGQGRRAFPSWLLFGALVRARPSGPADRTELLGTRTRRDHPSLAAGSVRHAAGKADRGRLPCGLHRQRLGAGRQGTHRPARRPGRKGLECPTGQGAAERPLAHRLRRQLQGIPGRQAQGQSVLFLGRSDRTSCALGPGQPQGNRRRPQGPETAGVPARHERRAHQPGQLPV